MMKLMFFFMFAIAAGPAMAEEAAVPEWGILVYSNGQDKTSKSSAEKKAAILENQGSSKNVSILLELGLMDNVSTVDPKIVRRYVLKKHSHGDLESREDIKLKTPAEYEREGIDMQRLDDLEDFIKWAKKVSPAKHYALILWSRYANYPLRCMNTCFAYKEDISAEKTADAIKKAGGVDIIVMDAPMLQTADWIYEFDGAAKYYVGAQGYPPENGYLSGELLKKLNKGSVSPMQAADFFAALAEKQVLDDEQQERKKRTSNVYISTAGYSYSMADISVIASVKKEAEQLALAIMESKQQKEAAEALSNTLSFDKGRIIDLLDFSLQAEKYISDKKVSDAANNLKEQIKKTVKANYKRDEKLSFRDDILYSRSGGISVFLPEIPRRDHFSRKWNVKDGTWETFRRWIYSIDENSSSSKLNGEKNPFESQPCVYNTVTGRSGYYTCPGNM